jgi:hypothetical protein
MAKTGPMQVGERGYAAKAAMIVSSKGAMERLWQLMDDKSAAAEDSATAMLGREYWHLSWDERTPVLVLETDTLSLPPNVTGERAVCRVRPLAGRFNGRAMWMVNKQIKRE